MVEKDKAEIWIKLSLSDLKASKILYEYKQYRVSYYLFQQATEKANKAFALKFEMANEDDLKEMGHNQFKLNRRLAAKELQELDNVLKESKELSPDLQKKYKNLKNGLRELDALRSQDLVNLTSTEINTLYKQVSLYRKSYIERNPKVKKALEEKEESKIASLLFFGLMQWMLDKAFMKLSISACGILTMQHNTLTRYPENKKDPSKIYNSKLPIIKKAAVIYGFTTRSDS